ncbi:hypothetical protein CU029_2692 [Enterococcus faecium]|nr:hypothetical protein [Enterococcus faecium]MBK4761995.1 hypothetical protein [Enterococcus faecium]
MFFNSLSETRNVWASDKLLISRLFHLADKKLIKQKVMR